MLLRAFEGGYLSGRWVAVLEGVLTMSHLLVTDDGVLFCNAKVVIFMYEVFTSLS
jgi:hypothetical protein